MGDEVKTSTVTAKHIGTFVRRTNPAARTHKMEFRQGNSDVERKPRCYLRWWCAALEDSGEISVFLNFLWKGMQVVFKSEIGV